MDKKIYAKIYLDCSYPLIIPYKSMQEFIEQEFENNDIEYADRYKIEFILMTDEEYSQLEEHCGW